MSDDKKQNFVQVNYDLLATKKLNSTQKLFISYIIGWQKNNLICKETNNKLASRFGLSYSGIRTVLHDLNKYDFFQAVQKDYNEENGTSGHDITVDEAKLKLFLNDAEKEQDNSSIKPATEPAANPNVQSESLDEDATQEEMKIKSEENLSILQYHNSDVIKVKDTMIYLGFSNDEADDFRAKIKSENVTFEKFIGCFFGITFAQKSNEYVGLRISEDQYELFTKMILDEF